MAGEGSGHKGQALLFFCFQGQGSLGVLPTSELGGQAITRCSHGGGVVVPTWCCQQTKEASEQADLVMSVYLTGEQHLAKCVGLD